MKKALIVLTILLSPFVVFSQRVLSFYDNYFPQEGDSGRVFVYVNIGYFVPYERDEKSFFQKSLFQNGAKVQEGSRLYAAEAEILVFPSYKYYKKRHLHAFTRLQTIGMNYVNSMIGLGVSDRTLNLSGGCFLGSYMRRVGSGGNFHTRNKNFDYNPLYGVYVETKSDQASFFISYAREREDNDFVFVRTALRVGNILRALRANRITSSLEAVFTVQDVVGTGLGLSFEPIDRTRVDISWVSPEKQDVIDHSSFNSRLTKGALFSIGYYFDE